MSDDGPETMLITPSGRPAWRRSWRMKWPEYIVLAAGFQTTVFPMRAGAVGRLPAMAVKLNGVTAKTKPSSGRCSTRFQAPGEDSGCWA